MPTTTLMPLPKQQFLTNIGTPLAGGKVYTFAAGTSTPKDTFTDQAGTVKQKNPVPLNARGEPQAPIYWSGNYRVEVRDSRGLTIYTVDNFNADPADLWGLEGRIEDAIEEGLSFMQLGADSTKRPIVEKLREIEMSITDKGAVEGGIVDAAPALNAAFQALKRNGIACGTIKVPAGRWRVGSLLDWDLVQNPVDAVLGDPAGTYRQFSLICEGTLVFDAGAGIKIQRGYNPKFILKAEGGAAEDALLLMENEVIAPYFEIYGNHYLGTLFKTLGTTVSGAKEGVKSLHGGRIVNQSCGQSLYIAGTSGTGHLDSVWDLTPTKGPELVNCWDFSIAHFENYTSVSRPGGTFKITGGGGHHFGTIALGNRANPYMDIYEAIDIEIANLNLADTNQANLGLVVRGGSVNIGNLTGVGCDRVIVAGNGASVNISNLHAHNSGSAILIDHDAERSGPANAYISVGQFLAKETYGSTIPGGIRSTIFVSPQIMDGWLTIAGGGILTGNLFGNENATIIDVQADEKFWFGPSNFTVYPHNGINSCAVKHGRSLRPAACYFAETVFESTELLVFSQDGRTIRSSSIPSPMVPGEIYTNGTGKALHIFQPVVLSPTGADQATVTAEVDFGAGFLATDIVAIQKGGPVTASGVSFDVPVDARYRIAATNATATTPTYGYTK